MDEWREVILFVLNRYQRSAASKSQYAHLETMLHNTAVIKDHIEQYRAKLQGPLPAKPEYEDYPF